jgi:hypothetical protein
LRRSSDGGFTAAIVVEIRPRERRLESTWIFN